MRDTLVRRIFLTTAPCIGVQMSMRFAAVAVAVGALGAACMAQDSASPKGMVKDGYAIHQSFDLGGHIANYSGSGAMFNTLVNLRSGLRILNHTLEMHAIGKTKYPQLFDDLMENSTGYGGDPNNFTMLRMSKEKLYDFQGFFRRNRQYFDYNLLANPLIPPGVTSNGYTFPQIDNSPHFFNTVRRMTDVSVTMLPISKVSLRAAYSQNIMQGPTGSSIHFGTEALLLQNWRNSTDTWTGGVDWKPFSHTILTYEEVINHYKGNTSWQLTGLNLQLSNGVPVTLGYDNITAPSCTGGAILNSATNPPTANARCNGYLQYYRYAPTRTLFPTEEFRFQSSNINNIQMNGRVRYTGANTTLADYNEYFNGLESRTNLRAATTTGYSTAKRISVSADYGIVWQVSQKIALSDQYDFWDFRQPGTTFMSEVDQNGSSMLTPPGPALAPVITSAHTFLGQKTHTNTVTAAWEASSWAQWSIGYRSRERNIFVTNTTSGTYSVPIRENGGLSGIALRPTKQWRVNGEIEITYADRVYTQISPRARQHYQLRSIYRPKSWATISGTFNDLERRNNVTYVNHLDHSRSFSAGASLTPSEHYGLNLSYGYLDVFTRTDECYTTTAAYVPVGTPPSSPTCVAAGAPYFGTGYYDAPTQFGSIDIVLVPIKRLSANLGYRMSAVNGTTEFLNPRQVPGSLQSQYHTPYGNIAWTLAPGWSWRAEWNYYGYGEGGPIGPTAPRTFHGNVYTFAVHYVF